MRGEVERSFRAAHVNFRHLPWDAGFFFLKHYTSPLVDIITLITYSRLRRTESRHKWRPSARIILDRSKCGIIQMILKGNILYDGFFYLDESNNEDNWPGALQ